MRSFHSLYSIHKTLFLSILWLRVGAVTPPPVPLFLCGWRGVTKLFSGLLQLTSQSHTLNLWFFYFCQAILFLHDVVCICFCGTLACRYKLSPNLFVFLYFGVPLLQQHHKLYSAYINREQRQTVSQPARALSYTKLKFISFIYTDTHTVFSCHFVQCVLHSDYICGPPKILVGLHFSFLLN